MGGRNLRLEIADVFVTVWIHAGNRPSRAGQVFGPVLFVTLNRAARSLVPLPATQRLSPAAQAPGGRAARPNPMLDKATDLP